MKVIEVDHKMKNASQYDVNPATFSRAVTVKTGSEMMYVSGTASVGGDGEIKHKGDFSSQVYEMFDNVTTVLREGGYTWRHVVRTTIYLKNYDKLYT